MNNNKKNVPLSASRIKVFQSCSWLYYTTYVLGLRDGGNPGSLRGSCCHNIFEWLAKKRHKKLFDKIVKDQTIKKCKPVKEYVRKYVVKNFDEFSFEENFDLIDKMTVEGLNYDFFGEDEGGLTEGISERKFDITIEDEKFNYRMLGFIDKLFLYKDKSLIKVRDFKTSKAVYHGDELEDNMQDLMYRLAAKHLYPNYKDIDMEFLFVKFDCNKEGYLPMPPISKNELKGFEAFLTVTQRSINNFGQKEAMSNLAANQGYPTKEEGFAKKLLCGYGKYKGHIKPSTGEPYWVCPKKWPFDYWEVVTRGGQTKTFVDKMDAEKFLTKEGVGAKLTTKHYSGCPAHNKIPSKTPKKNSKLI